jgi:hypothetical protein
MFIKLKTKETLLKEGWLEDDAGSLFNTDFDPDVGYFSYWFKHLLGKRLKVIDYLQSFYIVEPTFMLNALYIPKVIVDSEEKDASS